MARINIRDDNGFAGWFDDEKSVQWHDGASAQTLYRTTGTGKRGSRRWVLRLWQGIPGYQFISDGQAARWLADRNIDPAQDHVTVNLGGRPEIGNLVQVRLGALLPDVDEIAAQREMSRPDCIRHLIKLGLQAERQEPAS